jgi:tetratricopeptide (TPR) repeat protein
MKKSFSLLLIITMMVILHLSGSCFFGGTQTNKEVQKAFDLRMKGKVDEAKTLLEGILAKESTNAMAHYEMARLKLYMFVGRGNVSLDEIASAAGKAVTCEPANVVYAYFLAMSKFMNAFMAMQMQKEGMKDLVQETCTQFEKVLALKPDYHEARLYLVELYGMLPPDMGGDSLKATAYAEKLAGMDSYYGAMAKAALADENTDFVKFWEDPLSKEQKNTELMTEVGKAYLYKDDLVNAEKYFNEAMKADPTKNFLILDLARYHMYTVMQDPDKASTELPIAKTYVEKYLKSKPEPFIPMKAYAIGMLSIFERFLGNKEEADKWEAEARSLDPYFSQATGLPMLLLFDPPDKMCHHYFSFFKPF